MSNNHHQLVEKLNRIVFDKGDVSLLMSLDRIMDKDTDSEQAAVLGAVVKSINQQREANKG